MAAHLDAVEPRRCADVLVRIWASYMLIAGEDAKRTSLP